MTKGAEKSFVFANSQIQISAFRPVILTFWLYSLAYHVMLGERGDVVVKALPTNRQVAGSILDGVTGVFQ